MGMTVLLGCFVKCVFSIRVFKRAWVSEHRADIKYHTESKPQL